MFGALGATEQPAFPGACTKSMQCTVIAADGTGS